MSEMMSLLSSTSIMQKESINLLCQDVAAIKDQVLNIGSTGDNIIREQKQLNTNLYWSENFEKNAQPYCIQNTAAGIRF